MTLLIKELPLNSRPREKATLHGIESLSDLELLVLIIRHGNRSHTAFEIAHNLLIKSNGLTNLYKLSNKDLMSVSGIKKAKSLELQAILELSKRISCKQLVNTDTLSQIEDVYRWCQKEIAYNNQECFMAVYLNTRNEIITYKILFKGTLDRSLIHPREIFNQALYYSSAKIICVHNHPGGSLIPSLADIEVTKKLIDISKLVGIELIDHVIVANSGYVSIFEFLK